MDTSRNDGQAQSRPLIHAFPKPGPLVEAAYRPLDAIIEGPKAGRTGPALVHLLPRPWDPPTCTDPNLREQIWDWLERFVTWLNHEYVWDLSELIPECWPKHPHLVHEIATLADQRRTAGRAPDSARLEEWHRQALPLFLERMQARLALQCQDRAHQPWPARSSHIRHQGEPARQERGRLFQADVAATREETCRTFDRRPFADGATSRPVVGAMVDLATGELHQ